MLWIRNTVATYTVTVLLQHAPKSLAIFLQYVTDLGESGKIVAVFTK